jgi:hypothetical protein
VEVVGDPQGLETGLLGEFGLPTSSVGECSSDDRKYPNLAMLPRFPRRTIEN